MVSKLPPSFSSSSSSSSLTSYQPATARTIEPETKEGAENLDEEQLFRALRKEFFKGYFNKIMLMHETESKSADEAETKSKGPSQVQKTKEQIKMEETTKKQLFEKFVTSMFGLFKEVMPLLFLSEKDLVDEKKINEFYAKFGLNNLDSFKTKFGFLSLEKWVELGYTAIFLTIENSSAKGQKDNEDVQKIALSIGKQIIGKEWREREVKERPASLIKLLSQYKSLCEGLKVDKAKQDKMLELIKKLNQCEQLMIGNEFYSRPIQEASKIDLKERQPAFAFVMGLMKNMQLIVPYLFKNIKEDFDELHRTFKVATRNERMKQELRSAGIISLCLGKPLADFKKSCQDIEKTESDDPLWQFREAEDVITQGRRLERRIIKETSGLSNFIEISSIYESAPRWFYNEILEAQTSLCENMIIAVTASIGGLEKSLTTSQKAELFHQKYFSDSDLIVLTRFLGAQVMIKLNDSEGQQKELDEATEALKKVVAPFVKWVDFLSENCKTIFDSYLKELETSFQKLFKIIPSNSDFLPIDKKKFMLMIGNWITSEITGHFERLREGHLDPLRGLGEEIRDYTFTGAAGVTFNKHIKALAEAFDQKKTIEESYQNFLQEYQKFCREMVASKVGPKAATQITAYFGGKVQKVQNQLLDLQTCVGLLFDPLLNTLETVVNPGEDWALFIDTETYDPNQPIYENEPVAPKPEEQPKKKSTRRQKGRQTAATQASTTQTDAPQAVAAAPIAMPTQELRVAPTSTILSYAEYTLASSHDLQLRRSPADVRKARLERSILALYDQSYSLRSLERSLEMLQCTTLLGADKTPSPATQSLLSFVALETYLSLERGLTAQLLAQDTAMVLQHSLRYLLTTLDKETDNLAVRHLDSETITYRYPSLEGSDDTQVIKEKLPQLLREFIGMLLEGHDIPAAMRQNFEKILEAMSKEGTALQTHNPKISSSLSDAQIQRLTIIEQTLQQTCDALSRRLEERTLPAEERRLLNGLLKHVTTLSHLPSILKLFSTQRFMMVPAQMLMLSAQYALEHIGLLLVKYAGIDGAVRHMAGDVHDLSVYCNDFGLDEPLGDADKGLLLQLNVGKGFEYTNEHCARSRTIFPCMQFLNKVSEWSLVAADTESTWVPSDRAKNSKEENATEVTRMQAQLVDYTERLSALINNLVSYHILPLVAPAATPIPALAATIQAPAVAPRVAAAIQRVGPPPRPPITPPAP